MREKKQWLIVTFYTTSAAMAAEKACGQAGLPGRIIPVPREITADCGIDRQRGIFLLPHSIQIWYPSVSRDSD